jgi:hypothetical protein
MTDNNKRYLFLRDYVLNGMTRGDLPHPLYEYFYEDGVDIKYPTAQDYDDAIDELIRRETIVKMQYTPATVVFNKPDCVCGHDINAHYNGDNTSECFFSYNCGCRRFQSK